MLSSTDFQKAMFMSNNDDIKGWQVILRFLDKFVHIEIVGNMACY